MLPLNSTTPGSDMQPCNVELKGLKGASLAAAAGTTWEQICYKVGCEAKEVIEPVKLTQAFGFLSFQKKRVVHAGCAQPTEAQLLPRKETHMSSCIASPISFPVLTQ